MPLKVTLNAGLAICMAKLNVDGVLSRPLCDLGLGLFCVFSAMSEHRRAQCMAVTLVANREEKCLRVTEQCNDNFSETPLL